VTCVFNNLTPTVTASVAVVSRFLSRSYQQLTSATMSATKPRLSRFLTDAVDVVE